MHCSQVIWVRLGQVIRQYLKSVSQEHIPRVEISQLNVIYNVPQPSLLLYIRDKLTRNMLFILTQEVKSNIIYMGEAGDQFTKADSASLLNYAQTSRLLSVHWFGKVWQSDFSASNVNRT